MRVLISLVIFAFLTLNSASKGHDRYLGFSTTQPTQPLSFFDDKTFYEGVNKASTEPRPHFEYPLSGGVVPHHTLPNYMIANFFKTLARQGPKTIILIGPNHQDLGSFKALTSVYGWETPFGILKANQELINFLTDKELLRIDNFALSHEPSVAALVPTIKYYLPEVKVVPIILKSSLTPKETEVLGETLSKIVNRETPLVASVDFSHYLTASVAQEKDKVTLKAIRNSDLSTLFSLNSDYLDSPQAIALLLTTMEKVKAHSLKIIDHANSAEIKNDSFSPTTSYFVLVFH